MVIFNSYVSHYQRVYPLKTDGTAYFLGISHDFPMFDQRSEQVMDLRSGPTIGTSRKAFWQLRPNRRSKCRE